MKKLIFILLGLTLFSCKKFSHDTPALVAESCELCALADSLEASYEGTFYGMNSSNPFTNGYPYTYPTIMHVELEHVFLNKGSYIDSTVMFMKFTTTFPDVNDPIGSTRTYSFQEHSGNVTNADFITNEFRLTTDSIYIKRVYDNQYVVIKYSGLRQ